MTNMTIWYMPKGLSKLIHKAKLSFPWKTEQLHFIEDLYIVGNSILLLFQT